MIPGLSACFIELFQNKLRSSKFILHQLKENRRETTVAHIDAEAAIAETWMNTQWVFAHLQSEYQKMIEENVEAKACIYLSPQSVWLFVHKLPRYARPKRVNLTWEPYGLVDF